MPDIEDSLRRYADALERSATARVDAPPQRRRGALVACAAAIAVVAIASTAVLVTTSDRDSQVSTVGQSSTKRRPFPVSDRCQKVNRDREFEVFMSPSATSAQVAAVKTVLQSDTGVRSFRFLSHAAAYREFARLFRGQPGLITSTSAADLPESFRVKPRDAGSARRTRRRLVSFAGVDEVNLSNGCRRPRRPHRSIQTCGSPPPSSSTRRRSCRAKT